MDEPLSNLDAQLRQEMRAELRELQQRLGLTVVYVTHDQAEAMSMADQVVLLNKGRVEQAAGPRGSMPGPQPRLPRALSARPP
jgi:sn-glycerol 3-phosphate transport system ATP-binding protein